MVFTEWRRRRECPEEKAWALLRGEVYNQLLADEELAFLWIAAEGGVAFYIGDLVAEQVLAYRSKEEVSSPQDVAVTVIVQEVKDRLFGRTVLPVDDKK